MEVNSEVFYFTSQSSDETVDSPVAMETEAPTLSSRNAGAAYGK